MRRCPAGGQFSTVGHNRTISVVHRQGEVVGLADTGVPENEVLAAKGGGINTIRRRSGCVSDVIFFNTVAISTQIDAVIHVVANNAPSDAVAITLA